MSETFVDGIAGKVEDDHDSEGDGSEKVDDAERMTAAERFVEFYDGWDEAKRYVDTIRPYVDIASVTLEDLLEGFDEHLDSMYDDGV